jgi:hypothetical protein
MQVDLCGLCLLGVGRAACRTRSAVAAPISRAADS